MDHFVGLSVMGGNVFISVVSTRVFLSHKKQKHNCVSNEGVYWLP